MFNPEDSEPASVLLPHHPLSGSRRRHGGDVPRAVSSPGTHKVAISSLIKTFTVWDQFISSLKVKEGGKNQGGNSTTASHMSGAATWPRVGGSEAWRESIAGLALLSFCPFFESDA